ncbi:MAG: hypothetical protein ACRDGJ_11020 [Candidatus Limnocylindria bacterium]
MKQNMTIALEKETVRKAKILATQRSTSVSRLLGDVIERAVAEQGRYERVRDSAIAELRRGYRLGSGTLLRRDET